MSYDNQTHKRLCGHCKENAEFTACDILGSFSMYYYCYICLTKYYPIEAYYRYYTIDILWNL